MFVLQIAGEVPAENHCSGLTSHIQRQLTRPPMPSPFHADAHVPKDRYGARALLTGSPHPSQSNLALAHLPGGMHEVLKELPFPPANCPVTSICPLF